MGRELIVVLLGLAAWGCANPLNAITADRYATQCFQADHAGELGVADEACHRALVNVQMGNLGASAESTALYNWGVVKQERGQASEAETLLRESLRLQRSLKTPDRHLIAAGAMSLAVALSDLGRSRDAWPYLSEAAAMSNDDYGEEQQRDRFKRIFGEFAVAYDQLGLKSEAETLRSRAASI